MDKSSSSKEWERHQPMTCVNRYCINGDDLVPTIRMVCIFYHVKFGAHKMVCRDCLEQCLRLHRNVEVKMRKGKCIMEGDFSDESTDTDEMLDDDDDEVEEIKKVDDDGVNVKETKKIDGVNVKETKKIDGVNVKETKKIDGVNVKETKKIDGVNVKETKKIDVVNVKETKKIDGVNTDAIEKQDDETEEQDDANKNQDGEIEKQDDDNEKPSTSKENLPLDDISTGLDAMIKIYFEKNKMLEEQKMLCYDFLKKKITSCDLGDDINILVETDNHIKMMKRNLLTNLGPVDFNKLDETEDGKTEKKGDNTDEEDEDFKSAKPKGIQ